MTRTRGMAMLVMGLVMASLVAGCDDDDRPTSCELDGETYEIGETFPAGDDCNSCHCNEDGEVTCTLVACLPDAGD